MAGGILPDKVRRGIEFKWLATYIRAVTTTRKGFRLARLKDVGFAERRESATNTRMALIKKMQERLASPDVEAKLAERSVLVEARNRRLAEKEEIRRQEEAKEAAVRAEHEAKLAAERAAEEARLAAEHAEQERIREEEKAAAAVRANARASRVLTDLADAKAKRDARYAARKARQA